MNTRYLSKLIIALALVGSACAAGVDSGSAALSAALARSPAENYQCFCSIDCSGKTQLSAVIHMARLLEQELEENEGTAGTTLSDVFKGFFGLNTGAFPATVYAFGQSSEDISESLPRLSSKLITPTAIGCCLGCLGKSTKMANYFIDASIDGSELLSDDPREENNYDAIKLDSSAVTAISNLTSGTEADLKSCLTILSTSEAKDFSEQVLAAINESDNAARENAAKIAFNTIVDAAKTATSVAISVGGDSINKSAAGKALDIMTKVDETGERVGEVLENTVFKQNLIHSLASPTPDSPVFILNLRAETTTDRAIKTLYEQEIGDNFVKVTYTTRIPIAAYPSSKMPFEIAKANVESSVFNCMQSIRLDSARSTDIIADFLTAAKLARNAREG